jgi:hypothetical protein
MNCLLVVLVLLALHGCWWCWCAAGAAALLVRVAVEQPAARALPNPHHPNPKFAGAFFVLPQVM